MIEWKHRFDGVILKEGEGLLQEGCVREIKTGLDGYEALVYDSRSEEDFYVVVDIEQHQITDLFCNCDEGEDGFCCCHMAALLYQLEQSGMLNDWRESVTIQGRQETELAELLAKTDSSLLRGFLFEQMQRNDILRYQFVRLAGKKKPR